MIFVTIGTHEPFARLLQALDRFPGDEEIVVQCGLSPVRPTRATCVDFLTYDELVTHVRNARVVVAHAGVGTIMTSIENGKRPVVVPRLARLGEAVDDHQLELARRLDRAGLVTIVENVSMLPDVVSTHDGGSSVDAGAAGGLSRELFEYLTRCVGLEPVGAAVR